MSQEVEGGGRTVEGGRRTERSFYFVLVPPNIFKLFKQVLFNVTGLVLLSSPSKFEILKLLVKPFLLNQDLNYNFSFDSVLVVWIIWHSQGNKSKCLKQQQKTKFFFKQVLCTLTSKRVLSLPFTGHNDLFLVLRSFLVTNMKEVFLRGFVNYYPIKILSSFLIVVTFNFLFCPYIL